MRSSPALARAVRLRVELFEERAQPSVAHAPPVNMNLVIHPSASGSPGDGLTPAEIRHAYGIDQLTDDGSGQTIAIVVAFDDPNIASDLTTFDNAFGIAAPPSFTKQKMAGATIDSGWAGETALDVEWAHAVAPKANILLVEARSDSTSDLLTAVDYARRQAGVSVVSMSWGGNESSLLTSKDTYFTTPAGHVPVTFIAAAGDSGAGAEWPASSPNVLAVGGTRLRTSSDGTYINESAWSGSGGGFSRVYSVPTYQSNVVTGHRAVPDVAAVADPSTGVSVFNSVSDQYGESGWEVVGGTSAGSPQWAGLIALANQERTAHGLANIGRAQDTIYSLPASDFHDITAGGNGYSARVGYDLITGRGSPIANLLIPALAGETPPATTTTTTTPPSVGGTTGTTGTGTTTTTTGTGSTGTTTPPTTGTTNVPVWYFPIGFGWGFGSGLFGWNLGGWSLGQTSSVWLML